MKRETAPTSDSAQFILAWRSKDSVESAGSSQSEAQPGSGCNAIPGAAQSGGSKSPARGQSLNKRETMRGNRWRGGYDARGTWGDTMGIRRSEGGVNELNMEEGTEKYYEERFDFFFEGTGENINQSVESAMGQGRV